VETVSFGPGAPFDIEVIMDRVRSFRPEVIAVTHVESSTGTLFPLKEFTDALPREKPLLVVDAIASLGVEDLEVDHWGIDLVISAGQKALAAPPGISFICMNHKARERSEDCGRPLYYFSAGRYEAGCEKGDTPFTPAIQTVQILKYTLDTLKKTGWERMKRRHRESSVAITEAYRDLGMKSLSMRPASSVQAMKVPPGCDSSSFIEKLAKRYGVVIAGGQGELKGKVIRSGYTGLYSGKTLSLAVRAIGELLQAEGFTPEFESALARMEPLAGQNDIF
jgi:aspartate aminotransferase-like enzyme